MNAGDMDKLHDELIAYLEGELAPEARSRVERELEESREARAELDWLRSAYADIETVEVSARPNVPDIEIADSVMRSVQKAVAPANVISMEPGRKRRASWLPGLAAAAAALVITGYALVKSGYFTDQGTQNGRPGKTQIIKPLAGTPPKLPARLEDSKKRLDEQRNELGPVTTSEAKQLVITQGPKFTLPGSVSEIVAARRDAATSGASMDKLMQWARLAKKDALAIATAEDASPEAIAGAAQSLSGEEQRRVLLTAVGKLQEDPSARLQLARNYLETPTEEPAVAAENQSQAIAQLSGVKEIDPENALPYYFEAKTQFGLGDTAAALAALEAAGSLDKASAYSLESALAESAALEASGMEPDAARMVAALTAGVDENNFLCQLAGDLLEYGQGFLSANDLPTAEAIFKAVEQLGRQVEAGAAFSQEQLAGLDIQRYALDGLGQLYATVESAEGVTTVTDATNDLVVDVDELRDFFDTLDELFLKPMTTEFWNIVSGIMLATGDLALVDSEEVQSALAPSTTP